MGAGVRAVGEDPTWTLASAKSRRCCARARATCSRRNAHRPGAPPDGGRARLRRRAVEEDGRASDGRAWSSRKRTAAPALTYVDLVLVLEEMGRVVLPSPFYLDRRWWPRRSSGPAARRRSRRCCRRSRAGELIATVAWMEPSGRWDADGIAMAARKPTATASSLDGTKLFVNDAHIADYLLVAARTGRPGRRRHAVRDGDQARAGSRSTPLKTMDSDPQAQRSEVRQASRRVAADVVSARSARAGSRSPRCSIAAR